MLFPAHQRYSFRLRGFAIKRPVCGYFPFCPCFDFFHFSRGKLFYFYTIKQRAREPSLVILCEMRVETEAKNIYDGEREKYLIFHSAHCDVSRLSYSPAVKHVSAHLVEH